MGFTRGAGKYNDRIGALRFGQYVDGKLVEIGQTSGMTDALRNEMSDHPERFIGKVVTVKAMERLRSGSLRHPRYVCIRNDKNPNDCIYYPNEQ